MFKFEMNPIPSNNFSRNKVRSQTSNLWKVAAGGLKQKSVRDCQREQMSRVNVTVNATTYPVAQRMVDSSLVM